MTLVVNPTKVLVEDITEVEDKTKAGIILPNAVTKRQTLKGKILIVGQGLPHIPMVHKVGDVCLFHPSAGSKLTWEEKEYRLIDVADIFLSGV